MCNATWGLVPLHYVLHDHVLEAPEWPQVKPKMTVFG